MSIDFADSLSLVPKSQSEQRWHGERWSARRSGRSVGSATDHFCHWTGSTPGGCSRPDYSTISAHFPVPEPGTNVQNLRPVWPARGIIIRQKEHGGVGVLWCYGAMEEWRSCGGGVVEELWRFEMERRGVERRTSVSTGFY